MRKFIETEMEKLKGRQEEDEEDADVGTRYLSPEDAALLSLPEHLRQVHSQFFDDLVIPEEVGPPFSTENDHFSSY